MAGKEDEASSPPLTGLEDLEHLPEVATSLALSSLVAEEKSESRPSMGR